MVRANVIRATSAGALGGVVFAIVTWNYLAVGRPADDALRADARNDGVKVRTHFRAYVDPSTLVFDLRRVPLTASLTDVFRVFLQTADALKTRRFERVELAYRGSPRFIVRGDYFHQLGVEYGSQNPIYTIRTFPEHVHRLDGTHAYSSWSGGWLGVLNRQMEDFADVHRKWYLDDLVVSLAERSDRIESPQVQKSSAPDAPVAHATPPGPDVQPSTSNPPVQNSDAPSSTSIPDNVAPPESTASNSTARALTFADHIKAADAAPKFYLDEHAQTYHTLRCPAAKPAEMYMVAKPIVQLKRYPPHSCVLDAASSARR